MDGNQGEWIGIGENEWEWIGIGENEWEWIGIGENEWEWMGALISHCLGVVLQCTWN